MSRYCSITTCQKFSKSIKNAVNSKGDFRKIVEISFQKNVKNTNRFWNKILENITEFQHHGSKTICSASIWKRYDKEKERSKELNREIQKLCNTLHKRISQNKTLLWAATAVSVQETVDNSAVKAQVESSPSSIIVEPIPEPPPVPIETDSAVEVVSQLNALGEPTMASLGLGGYTPVGIVQNCFEFLHGTLGLDWWIAIVIGTIVVRACLFPLVILAQRNAAKMNNNLPQMQILQLKMTEARQTGNQLDAARYSQELMLFMKEKGLNPLKNMIVPLAQMPVFISFFMGLRKMANVPVESMRTGGIFWFTDLTLPDQYFLLPIITSATLYATIELGTDTAKLSSQNMQLMKYVLRGLPLIILPFTFNFPGAILCYWMSSNFISLIQVGFLRIPTVRDYFKIERLQTFNPEDMPVKPKGFTQGVKDSWENMKISKQLEERRHLDELTFQRAGKGPIIKTYKYDPTKQADPTKATSVSAKSR